MRSDAVASSVTGGGERYETAAVCQKQPGEELLAGAVLLTGYGGDQDVRRVLSPSLCV